MRKLLEANMSVDDLKSVRRMYRRDNYTKFSDHAFGSRFKKRMVIPLQPPKSKHKKEVEKHISSLGFTPHDYHGGIAKDKHGRDVKIGKILAKSGAHKLLQKFSTDPSRKASGELQVVITRHKADVHNMSDNKVHPWQSCLSKGGCNHRYLSRGVVGGVHVAYLTKKGDNKVRKPLARIALRPFEPTKAIDAKGTVVGKSTKKTIKWTKDGYLFKDVNALTHDHKTILKAQGRVYGNAPPEFHKTVKDWTKKAFPRTATEYKMRPGLHKDGDTSHLKHMPYHQLKAALGSGKSQSRKYAMNAVNNWSGVLKDRRSTEVALAHANSQGEYWHRRSIISKGNLRPSTVKWLVHAGFWRDGFELASNPHVSEKHKLELARKGRQVSAIKTGGLIHKAIARGEIPASRSATTVPYRVYRTQKKMSTLGLTGTGYHHLNQADQKDIIAKAKAGSKHHSKYIASRLQHSFHRKHQTAAAKAIHDDHLGMVTPYLNHYLTKSALAVIHRRKAKSLIASRLQNNA